MNKITRDISGIRKSRRPSPIIRRRPNIEEKRIKNGMASSSDYKVCTKWYVDNLFKNMTIWNKNDSEETEYWTKQEIKNDPEVEKGIQIVDKETSKIYNLSNWKGDSYKKIIDILKKRRQEKGISFFEPIFKGRGLNTDVVKENSIIRIWNTIKKGPLNNTMKYSHTMITIDNPTNNRRVSFGTWTDSVAAVVSTELYKKKGKGNGINLDTDAIGSAHIVNSPDNDFTSQILRARGKNIDVNNFIELKAVGRLTKDHIKNINKVLNDSYDLRTYPVDAIFRIKKKGSYTYVPLLCYYRQSSNLVYNTEKDLCYLGGGTLIDGTDNSVIGGRSIKRYRTIKSTNCSSFAKLLFPDIVCVTKRLASTLSKTFTGNELLASPGGIYGKQTYDCMTNNNVKQNTSYIQYKESPGIFGVSGYASAVCILPWKMNQFVAFALRYATCATGLYLIPIMNIPGGNIHNFILSASVLIGTTLNVFAYLKTNRNSLKFNYDDNTLEKNKNKLLQYYGKDNFVKLYNIYEKSLKSCKR